MRAVNLLPKDAQPRSFEKNRGVAFAGVGGFALVSVALSAAMLTSAGAIRERQATVDGLNAEIAALPPPVAPQEPTTRDGEVQSEKTARLTALGSALGGRFAWDRILRRVSLVLPDDVWLTSLSATGPSPLAVAGPPGSAGAAPELLLNGSTYSQDAVARLLSRLAVVPDLSDVQLQSSNRTSVRGKQVVQFVVRAGLKPAGAAS